MSKGESSVVYLRLKASVKVQNVNVECEGMRFILSIGNYGFSDSNLSFLNIDSGIVVLKVCCCCYFSRPADSLSLFMSPLRMLQLLLFSHKKCIIKFLIISLLIALVALFFYSMPVCCFVFLCALSSQALSIRIFSLVFTEYSVIRRIHVFL